MNKWISIFVFIIIIFLNISFLSSNFKSTRQTCDLANDIIVAGKHVEQESTVFPVTISDNFLLAHFSNYLGVDKSIVITDNYEAELTDFPIIWNYERIPNLKFGGDNMIGFTKKMNVKNRSSRDLDYVIIINDSGISYETQLDSNFVEILNKNYEIIYISENKNIILFKITNVSLI